MNRAVRAVLQRSNNFRDLGLRLCSTTPPTSPPSSASCSTPKTSEVNAPGLSKRVVDVPPNEVGFPGASKNAEYKNPEYFSYHNMSFFEAEVEMMKYRLPQPSNKPKA